jgi:hypothetical protein
VRGWSSNGAINFKDPSDIQFPIQGPIYFLVTEEHFRDFPFLFIVYIEHILAVLACRFT